MERFKSLMKNLRCKQILADADRPVLNGAFDKRSDPASPAGTLLHFLQGLRSFSERYCIFLFLLLPTFAFLLLTFNFAHAGGYIYWTPDGVLVSGNSGVGGG